MIKLIIISICFMIIGCIITDKIEEVKNNNPIVRKKEKNDLMDSEMLAILKNYELISSEDYIYGVGKSKET